MISTALTFLKTPARPLLKKSFIITNNKQAWPILGKPVSRFQFSKQPARDSSQSLLKHYFSSRLSLSPSQLQVYLVNLSKYGDVKIRDHRWQSLYMTIEKYQNDFSLDSKIIILQALGRMKQNNSLYLAFYRAVVSQFHNLTTNQISILIWSMTKAKQNDKTTLLAIYKKLYKIISKNQKIILYKQNQTLINKDASIHSVNDQQTQSVHHMYESSFVQLIWSLQRTKIIDQKLILELLKYVLQDKENKNLQKIRIENLSLLAYCMEQLQFEKYRVSHSIINQIIRSWQQLQSLSILSLVLLTESFSKFIFYQENYLQKYQQKMIPEQIAKKQEFLKKQKKFLYLIIETIFLRQDQNLKPKKRQKRNSQIDYYDTEELQTLTNPLSSKFASQILFNLGRVQLYDIKIWFKLLSCLTDDVDQSQVIDLSMALSAICNIDKQQISHEDMKKMINQHKKIICKRIFQIYTSLSGKSLQNVKKLVYQKKIENELVPTRVRKQVEKQFMAEKISRYEEDPSKYRKNSKNHQSQRNNEQTGQQKNEQQPDNRVDKNSKHKQNRFKSKRQNPQNNLDFSLRTTQ